MPPLIAALQGMFPPLDVEAFWTLRSVTFPLCLDVSPPWTAGLCTVIAVLSIRVAALDTVYMRGGDITGGDVQLPTVK